MVERSNDERCNFGLVVMFWVLSYLCFGVVDAEVLVRTIIGA